MENIISENIKQKISQVLKPLNEVYMNQIKDSNSEEANLIALEYIETLRINFDIARLVILKENIFKYVVESGGLFFELPKTVFKKPYNIKKIKAVYFNEQYDITKEWNDYINKIQNAIGVDSYFVLVRNYNNVIIGILAFYDSKGNEIKMKHFDKWNKLWNEINKI